MPLDSSDSAPQPNKVYGERRIVTLDTKGVKCDTYVSGMTGQGHKLVAGVSSDDRYTIAGIAKGYRRLVRTAKEVPADDTWVKGKLRCHAFLKMGNAGDYVRIAGVESMVQSLGTVSELENHWNFDVTLKEPEHACLAQLCKLYLANPKLMFGLEITFAIDPESDPVLMCLGVGAKILYIHGQISTYYGFAV